MKILNKENRRFGFKHKCLIKFELVSVPCANLKKRITAGAFAE
ncbi:hypothetical protein MNB_SUP05-SYMBIONT-4-1363 [hydrothermal vent metagenome]|uniref:Uncharacterized protein n=1 Tax=hydrothermal vent metagenome TaxID=652676 RepID=A0A1W1DY13_9ZZZZ